MRTGDLLQKLLEDQLSAGEAKVLLGRIEQDPRLRREVARLWRVHSLLPLAFSDDGERDEALMTSLQMELAEEPEAPARLARRVGHRLRRRIWLRRLGAAAVALLAVGLLVALAGQWSGQKAVVATITQLEGETRPVELGAVAIGERIAATGPDARVELKTAAGDLLTLGGDSELRLERSDEALTVSLAQGRLDVRAARRQRGVLRVATPETMVSVVGTQFTVWADTGGSTVDVTEGKVSVASRHGRGTATVQAGHSVRATSREMRVTARARDEAMAPWVPQDGWDAHVSTEPVWHDLDLGGASARYLVRLPPDYSPGRAWPVIMVLHSHTEGGPGSLADRLGAVPGERGIIAVYPQAMSERSMAWNYPDHVQMLVRVLLDTADRYHVDPNRLYLTGHSMGGGGAWLNGAVLRGLWAGIGPISGHGLPVPRPDFSQYRDLPVYCIHGTRDRAVPIASTRMFMQILERHGVEVTTKTRRPALSAIEDAQFVYREIQGAGKDVFTPWETQGKPEVELMLDWLLLHRREQPADLDAARASLVQYAAKLTGRGD